MFDNQPSNQTAYYNPHANQGEYVSAPPVRRPRPRWHLWAIIGGIASAAGITVLSLIALVIIYSSPGSSTEEITIPSGVVVAGIQVGDQTAAEATQTLTYYAIPNRMLTLRDGERTWLASLAELGINVDIPLTVQRALAAPPNSAVQPWYTIDLAITQQAFTDLNQDVNVNAQVGQAGRLMDIPKTLNRLYENLAGELADNELDLSMIETEPLEPEPDNTFVYDGPTTTHAVEAGQELALIARMYGVDMYDIVALNELSNPDIIWVGQELKIPAASVYAPSAAEAPAAPTTVGRSIVVSTGEQRIYAYENGQLVHSTLTSTGLPDTPTVKGDYKIYVKHVTTNMRGPDYYLENVPYTMYFYQGYGIHGTYWHNSFGRPMSHGCVNLPNEQAQWFFDWASVGTPVRVI